MQVEELPRLKLLSYLTVIFAICPTRSITSKIKVYATIIIITIICVCVYEFYRRAVNIFPTMTTTNMVIRSINTAIEVFINILVTATIIFYKRESYDTMLQKICIVNKLLVKYKDVVKKNVRRSTFIYITALHLLYVIIFSVDLLLEYSKTFGNVKGFFLFDTIMGYRCSVSVMHLYFITMEILDRIQLINGVLKNKSLWERNMAVPRDISNILIDFNEIMDLFNDVFGWIVLVFFIKCTFLFLTAVDIGLTVTRSSLQSTASSMYILSASYMVIGLVCC